MSYYSGMFPDLAHMKSPAGTHLWQPLALLHLEPCQPDVKLQLHEPVVATAVSAPVPLPRRPAHPHCRALTRGRLALARCPRPGVQANA